MNKDTGLLIFYIAGVIAVTAVHSPLYLTFIWFALIAVNIKRFYKYIIKIAAALAVLNAAVSAGYLFLNHENMEKALHSLLLFNLRTTVLLYASLLASDRISFFRALEFSPSLRAALYIAVSQYYNYKKIYAEFSEGYRLRSRPAGSRCSNLFSEWMFLRSSYAFILSRILSQSEEITLAMKCRGFFINRI